MRNTGGVKALGAGISAPINLLPKTGHAASAAIRTSVKFFIRVFLIKFQTFEDKNPQHISGYPHLN